MPCSDKEEIIIKFLSFTNCLFRLNIIVCNRDKQNFTFIPMNKRTINSVADYKFTLMKIVFIVLVVLLLCFFGIKRYLFRIGEPVNLEVSNSYFYHSSKNIVIFSPMGNWFELGYVESDADVDSFQPINENFGKDKNGIFWHGIRQKVDYETFEIDSLGVAKDKDHVYNLEGNRYELLENIKGADPKTYQLLDPSIQGYARNYWFKDANAVYYQSKRIAADPKTFKPINDAIAVDSQFIYAIVSERGEGNKKVEVNEVIRKYEIIPGEIHAINETYVQIGNSIVSAFTKAEFELHTFKSITKTKEIDYWKIIVNETLFNKGIAYPEIDIATFQELDYDFSKDKNYVYYDCKKIDGAINSSFQILSDGYSKDDKKVYYLNAVVIGANPKTFAETSEADVWEDGTGKYRKGKLMVEYKK
jgi:hypothetical protein